MLTEALDDLLVGQLACFRGTFAGAAKLDAVELVQKLLLGTINYTVNGEVAGYLLVITVEDWNIALQPE